MIFFIFENAFLLPQRTITKQEIEINFLTAPKMAQKNLTWSKKKYFFSFSSFLALKQKERTQSPHGACFNNLFLKNAHFRVTVKI